MVKVSVQSELDELSSILVGVSGEYFVAAELSRRGFIASITLRNTKGIDIIATNTDASRSVGISVKTSKYSKKDWMVNSKAESYFSDTLFYVFVNLNSPEEIPSFHVVPSIIVAEYTKRNHKAWLDTPNKKGGKHNDSPMRRFRDLSNEFLNKWELLGL